MTDEKNEKWSEDQEREFDLGQTYKYLICLTPGESHCKIVDRPFVEIKRLQSELYTLRQIISDSAKAIGNGSTSLPSAGIEFMKDVPKEIHLELSTLRAEIERLKEGLEQWRTIALDKQSQLATEKAESKAAEWVKECAECNLCDLADKSGHVCMNHRLSFRAIIAELKGGGK
jgi:regulator of replication initiation timing